MKYPCLIKTLCLFLSVLSQSVAWAAVISNPDSATYLDDQQGTGLFDHGNVAFSVEILDAPEFLTGTADPSSPIGAEFGFHFIDTPSILVPLFGFEDHTSSGVQSVGVDFNTGIVADFDTGTGIPEFSFITSDQAIGFYIRFLDPFFQAAYGTDPLYTHAALNGGTDVSAEFESITDSNTFLVSFAALDPSGSQQDLGSYLVQGITSVSSPAALWLMLFPLLALLLSKRNFLHPHNACIVFPVR